MWHMVTIGEELQYSQIVPFTIFSILRHRGHWSCVLGSNLSHWVPLPSPLGEKQVDGKISGVLENLGVVLIETRCRAWADDAVCSHKRFSCDCPMLHHDAEESLMTHLTSYIRSPALKFSKTLSFVQINNSHFKVFFGAWEWVGLCEECSLS